MRVGRVKRSGNPNHFSLGNQLFQIANTFAYAKRNNITPVFPELLDEKYCGRYNDTIFRNLKKEEEDILFYQQCLNYNKIYREKRFDYDAIVNGMSDFLFDGYYQSEKYFSDFSDEIRALFSVHNNTESTIRNIVGDESYATIHFRRGDYLNLDHIYANLAETDYYSSAMEMIEQNLIVLVSNDTEWAKTWADKQACSKNFIVSENNEIVDLYLMSSSDTCVIANSSFSWWGAWLGKTKKTISPKKWFLSELTETDIICEDWMTI